MATAEAARSPAAGRQAEPSVAQLAKAALRRLAVQRLEPTPENYERAWRQEAGENVAAASAQGVPAKLAEKLLARAFDGEATALTGETQAALVSGRWEQVERLLAGAAPPADALANLLERIVRGLDVAGLSWTPARRREGFQRVLASSRNDARKLQHRLTQLVNSWEGDVVDDAPQGAALAARSGGGGDGPGAATTFAALAESSGADLEATAPAPSEANREADPHAGSGKSWQRGLAALGEALQAALPREEGANGEAAAALHAIRERVAAEGASHLVIDELEDVCKRVERAVQHRHHLFHQLGKLCRELTASLGELAEDESWVKGQCAAMQLKMEEGLTARGVRQVSDMLHHARKRHHEVRGEREEARSALKLMIAQMLAEIAELGAKTGDFEQNVGRYAAVIETSDSLESLTGVVRELVAESRSVHSVVQQTQERLQHEHSKATGLSERVTQLEDEMRRLSDEVSTDQLTQVANRRGLMQAFEVERSRAARASETLSIGLLDIDNFKRLNDELGHSAGDEALKSLAGVVSKTLRPTDSVARYGGEEFVVLLPATPLEEGEQILTRLQRSLTNGLFMHKEKQVFVTFSAGVTLYREGERIEDALERADQALYEAKRTGKNRTCMA